MLGAETHISCWNIAANKHTDAIARYLVRRGHDITLLNVEYTGIKKGVKYVKGEYVYHRGYPYHPDQSWLSSFLNQQEKYDLFHHFGTEGSSFEKLRARNANAYYNQRPSVCSLWASRIGPMKLSSRWQLLVRRKPFRYLASREEGYAANHASIATVASASMKEQSLKEHKIPHDKIQVIHRGTDTKYFSTPPKLEPLKDTVGPIFLTTARLEKEKGIDTVLHAFQLIHPTYPSSKLYVVGDGPYRAALETLANQLSLQDHVCFTGRVSREKVREYYYRCDLFLLCSIFEPFGAVIIEAACAGKPAIVSDQGGPPEIVIHNKTGLLVDPNDPRAVANTILEAFQTPDLLKTMGQAAKTHVLSHYSFEQEAKEYEKLYDTL